VSSPSRIDHRAAVRALSAADPILAEVIVRVGACRLEPAEQKDIFGALLRSIIYQQLHGNAAAAIHRRVLAAIGPGRARAAALEAIPDAAFRAAGLSANKLLAVRDLAAKTLDGTIPTSRAAAKMTDDELIAHLTAVRGIGPWTVHMLMIFHLGRPDVLPTGDFAVRSAFSKLYRRGRKVTPEAMIRHAKRWQPYRSVASWYLWRSLDIVVPGEPAK
jgi:3-methyladenine DNA glycosylase/8-oxoguanine DNA glycosylase